MKRIRLLDIETSSMLSVFLIFVLFFGMFALNIGSTRDGNYLWLLTLAISAAITGIILINQKVIQFHKAFIYITLFVLFGVLSLAWAESRSLTVAGIRTAFLTYVILIFVIVACDNNRLTIENIYNIISIVGLLFVLYMVVRHGVRVLFLIRGGSIGSNLNSNSFGHTYFIFAVASFASYRADKAGRKSRYIVLFVFYSILLLLTASKSWMIAMILFFLLILMRRIKNKTLKILFFPLIIIFGLLLYVLLIRVPFFYKIAGYRLIELNSVLSGNLSRYTSTWYRMDMIKRAWTLFLQKPILGYGLNNSYYFNTYQWVYEQGTYFHNNYLELLVGVGLIGTLLFYGVYILALRIASKLADSSPASEISYIYLITCFFSDFTGVSFYYRPQIALIFIIYICGINALRYKNKTLRGRKL